MYDNNPLCQLLYRLFQVECPANRRFDVTQALKNYRRIVRLTHPDKCPGPVAHTATACLTQMWNIMRDPEHRENYELMGRRGLNSTEQELDWTEIEATAEYVDTLNIRSQQPEEPTKARETQQQAPTNNSMGSDSNTNSDQSQDRDENRNILDSDTEEEVPMEEERRRSNQNRRRTASSNSSFSEDPNGSFKQEIRLIIDHKTRRGQLKFKVIWEGYELGDPLWEHQQLIFSKFPIPLREYLKRLQRGKPISFRALIRRYEHLATVLKN